MHEASLVSGLLREVCRIADANGARRVTRVRVALGALSHLSAEHLREHFERAAQGSPAEGAQLDVRVLEDVTDPRAQEIVFESADIEEA